MVHIVVHETGGSQQSLVVHDGQEEFAVHLESMSNMVRTLGGTNEQIEWHVKDKSLKFSVVQRLPGCTVIDHRSSGKPLSNSSKISEIVDNMLDDLWLFAESLVVKVFKVVPKSRYFVSMPSVNQGVEENLQFMSGDDVMSNEPHPVRTCVSSSVTVAQLQITMWQRAVKGSQVTVIHRQIPHTSQRYIPSINEDRGLDGSDRKGRPKNTRDTHRT